MYDVVIIGAGAAGIGVAVALQDAEIENFIIIDSYSVGASFELWPEETRFITPSFATNSIGMLDINAISIGSSPAYLLESEHPTGKEYASYLRRISKHFELPFRENTNVLNLKKDTDHFHIDIENEVLLAKHVIWSVGEFQNPKLNGFDGSELCKHTSMISSYEKLEGDEFVVIGGGESGFDAAYNLANQNKKVYLLDANAPWEIDSSDPSLGLSTYSLERMRERKFTENVELHPNSPIGSVNHLGDKYEVITTNKQKFMTHAFPILATGFNEAHELVSNLFEKRDDGFPRLNEQDESTITSGLHLCGPLVRHDEQVFCFIYKYRQRFAVVAKNIATSLDLPAEKLEYYRQWGMYLDDLSCCGQECEC